VIREKLIGCYIKVFLLLIVDDSGWAVLAANRRIENGSLIRASPDKSADRALPISGKLRPPMIKLL